MAINPSSLDHLNHTVLIKNRKETNAQDKNNQITPEQEWVDILLNEESPAVEQWRYMQATDEMSAVLSQFANLRKLAEKRKKSDGVFSSFDSILEEDAPGRAGKIVSVAGDENVSMEFLRQYSRELFPDVSDLILVLRELIKDDTLEIVKKKKIKEILEKTEQEVDKKVLKSGINCAVKAKLFGKSYKLSPKLLRIIYREFLVENKEPVDIYLKWMTIFGTETRHAVTSFMEESLMCDICAMEPSCSKIEFGNFLGKLNELHTIKSVENEFMKEILKDKRIMKINSEDKEWIFFIVNIIKNPSSVDTMLAHIIGKATIRLQKNEIAIVLHKIYRQLKKIPHSLFKNDEDHQELISYFQHSIGKNTSHE